MYESAGNFIKTQILIHRSGTGASIFDKLPGGADAANLGTTL